MSQLTPNIFDTTTLFPQLEGSAAGAAKRTLFGAMTRVDYYDLDAIWVGHKEMPNNTSASDLVGNLAALLDLPKKDATAILGVSESRVSRNDRVDVPMLDRAQGVSEVFADVAAALGPEGAQVWFKMPNPGLGGAAPYKLLGTSYGEGRVRNLITALLNGATV